MHPITPSKPVCTLLTFQLLMIFQKNGKKDEYVHNRMSARLFSEVEQETIWIQAHFAEIKTPLLLMQGRDDKIMKITATRNLKDLAHGQVNYREWEYAGHQLHHSERSSEVMEYLVDWIKPWDMIKFRTEVDIPDFIKKMGYRHQSLMIGSCFTENIGNYLQDRCLPVIVNPFGILYNPASIANSIELLISGKMFTDPGSVLL